MEGINIKYDNWLSQVIGRKTFLLFLTDEFIKNAKVPQTQESIWIKDIIQEPVFIFTKINPIAFNHIKFVEDNGFYLIDTNIILQKNNLSATPPSFFNNNININFAMEEDLEQTKELAANSFIYSRFHLDKRFVKKIADKVKEEWVANYFKGKRGDKMVVAKKGNKVIGFLQLIIKNKQLIIDLIAVDSNSRRKGVAAQMINFATLNIPNINSVLVGTQLANIPSINFYQKLNFKFLDAKYIFHYFNNT